MFYECTINCMWLIYGGSDSWGSASDSLFPEYLYIYFIYIFIFFKTSSVVRIRSECSVSNFLGNCSLLNGPHCYWRSKEDSFSAKLPKKVFHFKLS